MTKNWAKEVALCYSLWRPYTEREGLASFIEALATPDHGAAQELFSSFVSDFGEHEAVEERMVQEIAVTADLEAN